MRDRRPVLGITMGDAAGVGPEIICMALSHPHVVKICKPLVIGDRTIMEEALKITRILSEVREVKRVSEGIFSPDLIEVLDLHNLDLKSLVRGKVSRVTGQAAFEYISEAVRLALAGDIQAVVTAPINKESLNKAGHHYAGHTQLLAELCGRDEVYMMLVVGDLWVVHVTDHVSLREVSKLITRSRILKVIELAHHVVRQFGIEKPRIAVAGLNPHSGEGGLFGGEEEAHIVPAVLEAKSRGLDIVGPLSPDTVFYRAREGEFDLVVAMYHDQGHIPLKLLGFFEGVNVTLGLPIVRTSVDHGTAFDKAGKGTANPGSLTRAIRLAVRLAK
ncbi:D-threonate 4-phosphate dehydrogenase [subsurface metagenome]